MSSQGFSFSQAHLAEIATDILKYAKKHGASSGETDVSEGFGQSVAVRKGEVDTIEYNRDKGVGVTVYLGQQRGYASTSDFSKKALKATVDAALSIARFTAPDPCAGLADAALMAKAEGHARARPLPPLEDRRRTRRSRSRAAARTRRSR